MWRKLVYIGAECFANYCILIILGVVMILACGLGSVEWAPLLFAFYAIVSIPSAIAAATVGLRPFQRKLGTVIAQGVYRPIRPIAMLVPAVLAIREEMRHRS